MQPAIYALLTGLFARLRDADDLWSDRIYLDVAPPDAVMPYVFMTITAGGTRNIRTRPDAEFSVQVRCVDVNISTALSCKQALNELLDDKGEQDNTVDFVNAGATWQITTITQDAILHITEQRPDNSQRTHAGDIYNIVMELRS